MRIAQNNNNLSINNNNNNKSSNTVIDVVITTLSNAIAECGFNKIIGQPVYSKCLTKTYTTVSASIDIKKALRNGFHKNGKKQHLFDMEEKLKRVTDTAKYLLKTDNFMPAETNFIVNMNNGEEPNKNVPEKKQPKLYELFPSENESQNSGSPFWHYGPNENLPEIDNLADFIFSGSNTNLNPPPPVERETYFPPMEEPIEVPGIVYNHFTQEFGYHSPPRSCPNRYDADLVETPAYYDNTIDLNSVIAPNDPSTSNATISGASAVTTVDAAAQVDTSKKQWDKDDQNFMFSSGVTHFFNYFMNPNDENKNKLKQYFGDDLFDVPGRFNEVLFGGNRPESRSADAELISLESLSLFDFLDEEDTYTSNVPVEQTYVQPASTSTDTATVVTPRSASANGALSKNKYEAKSDGKPPPRPITKSRSLDTIQSDAIETASSNDEYTNNSSSSCNSEVTLSNHPRAITKTNECSMGDNNGVQTLAVQPPKRPIVKTNNLTRKLDLKNAASDDGKRSFLSKVNRSKEISLAGNQSTSNLRPITKRSGGSSHDEDPQTSSNEEIASSSNDNDIPENSENQNTPSTSSQNLDAANPDSNSSASDLIKKEFFKRVWEMVRDKPSTSNPRPITKKHDEE